MIINVDRKIIKKQLPAGSGIKIAEMAGVSRGSVSCWFSEKTNSKQIEDAALKLLSMINRDRKRKLSMAGLI